MGKSTQSGRIGWIEALRTFAMLMVVVPHFIATFCPEVFNVWQTCSMLLKGINGKHGVAIFCVLIGYFASAKRSIGFVVYSVRRYLQFAINILLVLVAFTFFSTIISGSQLIVLFGRLARSIVESALFMDRINPTLWCVRDLFFGSLICFVIGSYCEITDKWKKILFVLGVCSFMYFVDVWIAICILGVALRFFQDIVLPRNLKLVLCAVFIVFIPLLYRHEESIITYFMQGVSCCLLLYVCMYVCMYVCRIKCWIETAIKV